MVEGRWGGAERVVREGMGFRLKEWVGSWVRVCNKAGRDGREEEGIEWQGCGGEGWMGEMDG